MTSKGKSRTPPDLMSELLGSLQEDVPLPGERPSEVTVQQVTEEIGQQAAETTEQQDTEATKQQVVKTTEQQAAGATSQQVTEDIKRHTDLSSRRLVDLSARPQAIKMQTRKRDGVELTRKTHYLTPDQARTLKEYAFMTGQGESEVVRHALSDFFAQHGHQIWGTGEKANSP